MNINFEPWGELPLSNTLVNALSNAGSAKLTPLAPVDRENQSATFSGDHGIYKTTLTSCVTENGVMCGGLAASKRKGLPCKHILRLAMELGLIDYEFKTDPTKIHNPKPPEDPMLFIHLATVVAALETYPELLPNVLDIINSSGTYRTDNIEPFFFFIENGLLTVSRDFSGMYMPLSQKQCVDALEAQNYEFPEGVKLKRDKYAYACDHIAETFPLLFPDTVILLPGEKIKPCLSHLTQYLTYRVNDTSDELYLNQCGEFAYAPRRIGHLHRKVQELLRQYDPVYSDEPEESS